MNAENFSVAALLKMAHSPVRNYVVPGLTSSLIGAKSDTGTIRLFECERDQQEAITPHSHRFNFQCWVLSGSVRNRIWSMSYDSDTEADWYTATTLSYSGEIGQYEPVATNRHRWRYADSVFGEGECYSMRADEVHSIWFSRGAKVLFFEGPTLANESKIIEPYVNGATVPTMEVKPWMFARGSK